MPHDDYPSDYSPEAHRGARTQAAEAVIPLSRGGSIPVAGRYVKPRKRPITVSVAGERSSGKTTLIAVVAQALRNADHLVQTEPHVPSGAMAVRDLHEQFDVTFVEAYETDGSAEAVARGEAPATATDAINDRDYATKTEMRAEITALKRQLIALGESHAKQSQMLYASTSANAELEAVRVGQVERLQDCKRENDLLLTSNAELVQKYEAAKEAHVEATHRVKALCRENAQLRATIDEQRGKIAGLSGARVQLAAENARLTTEVEAAKAEAITQTGLRKLVSVLIQAMQRHTPADDARRRVKELSTEMHHAVSKLLTAERDERDAVNSALFEMLELPVAWDRGSNATTGRLFEANFRAMSEAERAVHDASKRHPELTDYLKRDADATAKLRAANLVLMGEEGCAGWGVAEDAGC